MKVGYLDEIDLIYERIKRLERAEDKREVIKQALITCGLVSGICILAVRMFEKEGDRG